MKKFIYALVAVLVILITGCRIAPNEQQAPQTTAEPIADHIPATQFPTISPAETGETLPTLTATAPDAGQSSLDDLPETGVDRTVEPTPTMGVEITEDSLPSPSLFPESWDERNIYQSGLISEETGILQELPGATVYHLILDINDPSLAAGRMEARYINQENELLNELYLHMFPAYLGGDMEVASLLLNGQPAQFEVLDGVLRVDLNNPLAPGQGIVLSLTFETSVPDEGTTKYGVLAFKDNILALAHFYPMFAVYDDQGWHIEPTADHGDETFADASFYLVQVNAPAAQVLVSTGVVIDLSQNNGQQQVTFAAGPVRDFYLAASDDFEAVQRQVGQVLVSSYAPSGLLDGAQIALDATAEALQSFSDRFGPYPYSELDIVTTSTDALGIEYPGIYANALRIYDLMGSSSGISNAGLIESVSAHETAHQWFYNLVGNDQLNEPWLDEATAQYATWLYYIDQYGEQNAQGYYNSLEGRWERTEFADIPIGLPASAYSGLEYSGIVYGRGPIFLNELAELMGQETFDDFLRDYTDTYRWQIAYGEDFMELAEQHCGCDLSGLFAEQVFGS